MVEIKYTAIVWLCHCKLRTKQLKLFFFFLFVVFIIKTIISSRAMKNFTVILSLENKKKWFGKSLEKVLNSVLKKVYEPCLLYTY